MAKSGGLLLKKILGGQKDFTLKFPVQLQGKTNYTDVARHQEVAGSGYCGENTFSAHS